MSFSKIGHYQIIEEIGKGHFGTVYRAYDPRLERDVALKVAAVWEDERLRLLFLRKMQSLLSFEHPAIVPIYDFGQEDGQVFIVSKLMSGGSLADQLKQRSYSLSEIAHLLASLAPALDDAHANQLIHDHLSPNNILFDHRDQPYWADFGLHKFFVETCPPTLSNKLMGNPAYMSPEQLRASLQRDQRSDIYALGVILFELLTGQIPYQAYMPLGMALAHVNDAIPDVTLIGSDLPAGTQEVIERVLAKAPDRRYPTATALSEAVMALIKRPIKIAEEPTASTPMIKATKPSKKLLQYVSAKKEEVTTSDGEEAQVSQKNEPDEEDIFQEVNQEEEANLIKPRLKSSFLQRLRATEWPLRWVGGLLSVLLIVLFAWFFMNGSLSGSLSDSSEPVLEIGSIETSSKDNAVMVYVPAGEFVMGSEADDPNAYRNEKPPHLVYLDAFWIDQTEVTNAMFARFIEETAHQTEAKQAGYGFVYQPSTDNWEETNGADWTHPVGPENSIIGLEYYPVVQVSWNDANAYCEWADRRLPTEAEWEKAARGVDARQYPWGNNFNGEYLNYCDTNCIMINSQDNSTSDGYLDIAPVGTYPTGSSPYNALDMSGNVWEWVADWFDETYYQTSPNNNPLGPENGTYRTLRGGSWSNGNIFVRSAVRTGSLPSETIDNLGFRCAMSP